MVDSNKLSKKVKEYDQKEFKPCDIKLILLGDSAVGKSKSIKFLIIFYNNKFYFKYFFFI